MKDESGERKNFGARLRDARVYSGFSQEQAAKALHLARPTVSMIEAGRRRVDVIELQQFARVYQRSLSELTGDIEIDPSFPEAVQHLALAAAKLTVSHQAELLRFAEFLSTQL